MSDLPPQSLTYIAPKKMMVGRQAFPIGRVTFQGRTVKLREGIVGDTVQLPYLSRPRGCLVIPGPN